MQTSTSSPHRITRIMLAIGLIVTFVALILLVLIAAAGQAQNNVVG
jgi:hypothetical protein